MINFIKKLLGLRSISDAVSSTRIVKIDGVRFKIKKIDVLDYMTGAKVMLAVHNTYRVGAKEPSEADAKKVRSHYIDVLMSGVVEPKLSRKEDGDGLFIEKLFSEWGLVDDLYTAILEFTYGKKKIQSATKDYTQKKNAES